MELGGQVLALGTRPDGSAWTVGVRDPRPDDGILREPPVGASLATCAVKDMSVVTSGTDQRGFFTADGVRYHHLIDPQTLYPGTRYLSVTVSYRTTQSAGSGAEQWKQRRLPMR